MKLQSPLRASKAYDSLLLLAHVCLLSLFSDKVRPDVGFSTSYAGLISWLFLPAIVAGLAFDVPVMKILIIFEISNYFCFRFNI